VGFIFGISGVTVLLLKQEGTVMQKSNPKPENQQRYSSPRWSETRREFLNSHPFCALCVEHRGLTPSVAVDLDLGHIPRWEDHFWDTKRWVPLCKKHLWDHVKLASQSGSLQSLSDEARKLLRNPGRPREEDPVLEAKLRETFDWEAPPEQWLYYKSSEIGEGIGLMRRGNGTYNLKSSLIKILHDYTQQKIQTSKPKLGGGGFWKLPPAFSEFEGFFPNYMQIKKRK
jgi:hypothetical protein